jgi:hypothetical protein
MSSLSLSNRFFFPELQGTQKMHVSNKKNPELINL